MALANRALTILCHDTRLNLTEINQLIYATALAVQKEPNERPQKYRQWGRAGWRERIQKAIDQHRTDLAIVREYRRENNTNLYGRVSKICAGVGFGVNGIQEVDQRITMKLQAKAQRLRRYCRRYNQFHQNKLFKESMKRFYQQLQDQKIEVDQAPTKDAVENFWMGVLEDGVEHLGLGDWEDVLKSSIKDIKEDEWRVITKTEFQSTVKKLQNWKTAGHDGIQNFWIKRFSALHDHLLTAYNRIMGGTEDIPMWMTCGVTYLIPKNKDTKEPENYRPITCLPTMYKLLTAIISSRIYQHCLDNNLMPEEQKGCCKGSRGCKEQLLISQMIMQHVKTKKKQVVVAWIDYRKAFDSVPHSWIKQVLRLFKINNNIIRFLEESMNNWRTTLRLRTKEGTIATRSINIKRGIFQGDSLSPLLFCIAMAPLSRMLESQNHGYKIYKEKISHLLYMDDLKIFAADEQEMCRSLQVVELFSESIRMKFGMDKCAVMTMKHGLIEGSNDYTVGEDDLLPSLSNESSYKYLGMEESDEIHDKSMKNMIQKEYISRLRRILSTELNSKNKITAINGMAIPVLLYSFGILQWTQTELTRLDRKTRKLLISYHLHHPRADKDRLYISRQRGGRGLMEIQSIYKRIIVGLSECIGRGNGRLIRMVKLDDEKKRPGGSLQKKGDSIKDTYHLTESMSTSGNPEKLKELMEIEKLEMIDNKPLHSGYFRSLQRHGVDKKASTTWLTWGVLKGETESLLIAAQDQALSTKYHQKMIWKKKLDSRCRLCHSAEETVSHIISGCSMLAPTEYLKRHNNVASYIHWKVCLAFNIQVSEKYYQHLPEPVVNQSDDVVIMWDVGISTDRTIPANRPDIVVLNKKEKTCILIEISVPDDANLLAKETEKKLKYRDLEIEIQRMWLVRCGTVPVVVGALGMVGDVTVEGLAKIPGRPELRMVQKIALLGTAHILRRTLG